MGDGLARALGILDGRFMDIGRCLVLKGEISFN